MDLGRGGGSNKEGGEPPELSGPAGYARTLCDGRQYWKGCSTARRGRGGGGHEGIVLPAYHLEGKRRIKRRRGQGEEGLTHSGPWYPRMEAMSSDLFPMILDISLLL